MLERGSYQSLCRCHTIEFMSNLPYLGTIAKLLCLCAYNYRNPFDMGIIFRQLRIYEVMGTKSRTKWFPRPLALIEFTDTHTHKVMHTRTHRPPFVKSFLLHPMLANGHCFEQSIWDFYRNPTSPFPFGGTSSRIALPQVRSVCACLCVCMCACGSDGGSGKSGRKRMQAISYRKCDNEPPAYGENPQKYE